MVRRLNLLAFLFVPSGLLFGVGSSTAHGEHREGAPPSSPTSLPQDPKGNASVLGLGGDEGDEEEEDDEEEENDKEKDKDKDKDKEKEKEKEKQKGEDEEDDDEDEKDEGKKPEGGKPGSAPTSPRDPALEKPSANEIDRTSPQVVVKEQPAFVVFRPGAGKSGKALKSGKASAKGPEVDGSRWGFVDMAERKKRRAAWWDQMIVPSEKQAGEEQVGTEEEREAARKQAIYYKAQKAKEMKALERIRCRVELIDNAQIYLEIYTQDRPAGLGENQVTKSVRGFIEQGGFSIDSERSETWRGKKTPGHTFIIAGHAQASENASSLRRRTYFLVAKPRNAGFVIVFFDCNSPRKLYDAKLEKEFDAFIRGTQFTN